MLSLFPSSGTEGTVVRISVVPPPQLDFTTFSKLYFNPLIVPMGLPGAGAAGTTFFGYDVSFSAVDDRNMTVVVPKLENDPFKGPVAGRYGIIGITSTG